VRGLRGGRGEGREGEEEGERGRVGQRRQCSRSYLAVCINKLDSFP